MFHTEIRIAKKIGGPAFPEPGLSNLPNGDFIHPQPGMSLRQYAAIKLKIPDSGTDWLDEMIRQSLRDDFAAMVAAQCLGVCSTYIWAAEEAYKTADEITRLRGEAGVLMGLLRECLVIVDVCHIEAESTEEREKLGALMNSIHAALHHPTEPLTDWSAA